MSDNYIAEQSFERFNELPISEYENCTFNYCDLQQQLLKGCKFINCHFNNCNLSLVHWHGIKLDDVHFNQCKLVGARFDGCEQFGLSLSFYQCQLNHASFFKLNLKKTKFENCMLHSTDFSGANLTEAIFTGADLLNANFEQSVLDKADLSTAVNYIIDPRLSSIKKTKFSLHGLPGLLSSFNIVVVD